MTARILVVCGARVLDATPASVRWSKREIAAAMSGFRVGDHGLVASHIDLVAHGDARGPDAWADEVAAWLGIPRVVFPCWGSRGWPVMRYDGRERAAKNAGDRYNYNPQNPHGRNAMLMKWAADRAEETNVVRVLALRAPWATTDGTGHAVRCATDRGLDVMALTCSLKCGPTEGR